MNCFRAARLRKIRKLRQWRDAVLRIPDETNKCVVLCRNPQIWEAHLNGERLNVSTKDGRSFMFVAVKPLSVCDIAAESLTRKLGRDQ